MILQSNIITNLEIHSLEDLYKLKPLTENSSLNINKSQIARELGVDRRTVDKYYSDPFCQDNFLLNLSLGDKHMFL